MSEQIDAVERMAKEALVELQREYQMRSQPYIDILCRIEALKPPSTMLASYMQWEQMQKNPPPVKEREKSR
jgi:hypothetical protein